MRGRIDVSFMLLMRAAFANSLKASGMCVYVQVDASPQGGRDYGLIILSFVRCDAFPRLAMILGELQCLCRQDQRERVACLERQAELLEEVKTCINWHVAPIVTIGQGRGSMALKLRAFVHSLGLLSKDARDLASLLRSIVSFTTDYGTEVGFPRIAPTLLSQVLPHIHAQEPQAPVRPDGVARVEPQFDEGIDASVEAGALPRRPPAPACNRREEDFGDELPAAPPLGPSPSAPVMVDLTHSLEAPGMMHVIHNATNGLHAALKLFKDMLLKLKKSVEDIEDEGVERQGDCDMLHIHGWPRLH